VTLAVLVVGGCAGSWTEAQSDDDEDEGDDGSTGGTASTVDDDSATTDPPGSTSQSDPTGDDVGDGPDVESSSGLGEDDTTAGDDASTTGTGGGPACGGLVWTAAMDADPTALDGNADAIPDWSFEGTFPTEALVGGVWQAAAGTSLATSPDDTFAGRTVIDVRLRTVEVGVRGAAFLVYLGQDDETVSPLWVNIRLEPDTTQSATVGGRTAPTTNQQLASLDGMSSDFVEVHLDADVVAGQVAITVAGQDLGTHALPSFTGTEPHHAEVGAQLFAAEIDFVTVERCPS
jgi:hypothetical protein